MGLSVSVAEVKNVTEKVFNMETQNDVMQKINVVMMSKNEIIFKNIAAIRNLKANFSTIIKNQIIAKIVLDAAEKNNVYDEILTKVHEKQESSGVFATNADVKRVENILKTKIDSKFINRQIQNIREAYDVSNSFKVENDTLIPTSIIENVDLNMTNQMFNKSVYDSLLQMSKELDDETRQEIEKISEQKTAGLSNEAIIAVAAVAVVGGIIFLKKF